MEVTLDPSDRSEREPESYEKGGEKLFWASAFIASAVAVHAVVKKKRVYSFSPPVLMSGGGEARGIEEVIPEKPPEAVPKCPLPSAGEEKIVRDLFTNLATLGDSALGVIKLGLKKTELKGWGNGIKHLHPFTLLIAMPKDAIRTIFSRRIITRPKSEFTKNLLESIRNQWVKDNILPLLPDFAEKMGRKREELEDRFTQLMQQPDQGFDWCVEFVHYLYDIKSG